ncbi:alanine--tRNA ligase [Candidatus Micrarchaeota archaeon]|nr:alanine--tRNA ligase [Candidatus Micrarchaeota archaeon]
MLTKESLIREFEKEYKKYYEVELFRKEGFTRKKCKTCNKAFWSTTAEANCGDSSHNDYSFFGKQRPKSELLTYSQFWKKYADFWKKNGHELLPRYPVICRWRDDLYFTIASIVDFQRLEKGKVVFEYPSSPLMVPQICLRFVDIANVGVTGRHLSCFMMAGQHAFNEKKSLKGEKSKEYWKDETIEFNFKFLTQVLGIPKDKITYGEDLWHMPDFSAFGPSIESFSGGLELVNSVFMQFRATSDGKFEELDTRVIDVGWGFERLLWFYNKTLSVYDSVFPEEIAFMRKKSHLEIDDKLYENYSKLAAKLNIEEVHNLKEEKEKIASNLGISLAHLEKTIAPLQAIYAISDHSRSLLFALTDGALPSNSAGGYNLRILLRRAFGFIDEYGFDFDVFEIMQMQAKGYKEIFPELSENLEGIKQVLIIERRKYEETKEKAKRLATEILKKGDLNAEKLQMLYESHGVTPEILENVAKSLGIEAKIPTDYYRKVTEKHIMDTKTKKDPLLENAKFQKLPKTKLIYYEDVNKLADLAKVIAIFDDKIVLDKSIIYPEGGGQVADFGTIGQAKVLDAQKTDGVVLMKVDKPNLLKEGSSYDILVDKARRMSLRRHHSATHIMIASCRQILGNHIWQAGAKKEEEEAHLDITHYEKPSLEQLQKIEQLANKHVLDNVKVNINFWNRGEAERKYGFRLYQGGGAIGNVIRVVEYVGVDVEACGGLHCESSGMVGIIKIVGCEQIQDGVVRIRYKAGEQALKWIQKREEILKNASFELKVQEEQLPATVKRFFDEWKSLGKQLEKAQEDMANNSAIKLVHEAKEMLKEAHSKKLIKLELRLSPPLLERVALEVSKVEGMAILLTNPDGFAIAAVNEHSKLSALDLIKEAGAKGGGNKNIARGKIIQK